MSISYCLDGATIRSSMRERLGVVRTAYRDQDHASVGATSAEVIRATELCTFFANQLGGRRTVTAAAGLLPLLKY